MSFIKHHRRFRAFLILIAFFAVLFLSLFLSQVFIAHRDGYFSPDYPKVDLSELLEQDTLSDEDYETVFLQTGLARSAVDTLLLQGAQGKETLLDIQNQFFNPPSVECVPLLGWFTREDRLVTDNGDYAYGPEFVNLEPGDIIITLSTHSFGWRHGHAGLVIDPSGNGTTLECVVLGTNSRVVDASHWRTYSNYVVLRVKGITAEEQNEVVNYAMNNLMDVPYHLTAGFIGLDKAPDPDYWAFGLQCSYLVWYAWNHMGYDLDSDGGRLATSLDMLQSNLVEVVQLYGFDPREFTN